MDPETTQDAAQDSSATITEVRVRLLDKCRPLLPVISPIIAVLSFMSGTFFSAYQQRNATAQSRAAAWREALQKVAFDENNLVPTAFLMESFDEDPDYKSSARQIERNVLEQTNRPATFDLIFWNMVNGLRTPDEVNDAVDVGRALDERLYSMWEDAVKQPLGGGDPQTFEYFLQHPERFYPAKSQTADRDRAFVLIWQLDTFSQALACMFTPADDTCPHPAFKDLTSFDNLYIINHPLPPSSALQGIKLLSSCAVHQNPAHATFYCETAAPAH